MRASWTCLGLGPVALCCANSALPDPRLAVRQYEAALERNDAHAVHAFLSADARAQVSERDVRRWLDESRPALQARAKGLSLGSSRVSTRAQVRYADGEVAELALESEGYKIDSAALLPAGARTPAAALAELRRALSERSYSGLAQVLTAESRAAFDAQMRSLITSLEQPNALPVEIDGNHATLITTSGHRVELELQDGVWKVRDFE
ncbi:MAG TPA: hypothetical protein VHM70_12340 [Polyangiaceae bacterium]|jgi:hypothetical protein|nr:hypothetical protein [Polyangiaceae bacterium]